MRDKKMNLMIIIVCVVAIGATFIVNMTNKGKSEKKQVEVTTTVDTSNSYNTEDQNTDIEQYLNGNTLKNNPDSDESAFDTVDSIVKVEDNAVNPIFTDMQDIKRSLPSMIEAQIMEQNIDLGLNSTVTVQPEPKTFNETDDMISFEMFFNELVPMIHIEYVKESGEMKVLIYERTKENLKKYGWDKVLEENYNISIN